MCCVFVYEFINLHDMTRVLLQGHGMLSKLIRLVSVDVSSIYVKCSCIFIDVVGQKDKETGTILFHFLGSNCERVR